MSTQPVARSQDPRDPERILARLPEREHARFLREYQAAAEAAAHEVWRYKQLQELLSEWSILAASYSTPGFYAAREDVRAGRGNYTGLDDVIARRQFP